MTNLTKNDGSAVDDANKSVRALEGRLAALPQVDLNTTMLVHGLMCARTILIPAGTVLTGVETNIDNICVVSGDITVTTKDGPRRLTGFNVISALAGFKRAGVAHADTYWTTIHHTHLSDHGEIEAEMTPEPELLQTTRLRIESTKKALTEAEQCHMQQ